MVKANKKKVEYESVKLRISIVEKVRKSKETTGVSIASFFEQAAEEKLKIIKK